MGTPKLHENTLSRSLRKFKHIAVLSNLSFVQNTFCNEQAIVIQGPFKNIQGVLGKIQGLFNDMMRFQGLFKACANHVSVHFI